MREFTPEYEEMFKKEMLNAVPTYSKWEVFRDGIAQGFEENVTGTLGSFTKAIANDVGIAMGVVDNVNLPAEEVNAKYNLTGDKAFKEGEIVPQYYAEMVGEQAIADSNRESLMRFAETQGGAGVVNFFGNLVGGMADPIGVLAGNAVGKLGFNLLGSGLVKAAESADEIGTVGKAVLNAGAAGFKKLEATNQLGRDFVESFVGAAIVDAPAYALNASIYREELEADEYIKMVAMTSVAGTALPALGRKLGGKGFLGQIKTTYGDNAEAFLQLSHEMKAFEKKTGQLVNDSALLEAFNEELHGLRAGQKAYTYEPVQSFFEIPKHKYYTSHRAGDVKLYQDSRMGSGSLFITDNRNLVENAAYSKDGKTKGSVLEVDLGDAKIAGPEHLGDIANGVLAKHGLSLKDIGEFSDIHEFRIGLERALPDGVDASFAINKVVTELGYDGYHAPGTDLLGKRTHNGVVLLDSRAFGAEDSVAFKHVADGVEYDEYLDSIVHKGNTASRGRYKGKLTPAVKGTNRKASSIRQVTFTSEPSVPKQLDVSVDEAPVVDSSKNVELLKKVLDTQPEEVKVDMDGTPTPTKQEIDARIAEPVVKSMAQEQKQLLNKLPKEAQDELTGVLHLAESDEKLAALIDSFSTCIIGG